jgi:hypothetical protein
VLPEITLPAPEVVPPMMFELLPTEVLPAVPNGM